MTFSKNYQCMQEDSALFCPRIWLKNRLRQILERKVPTIVLVSEPGMGKTHFLRELLKEYPDSPYVQVRRPLGTNNRDGFWSALLTQLDLDGSKIPHSPHEAARWARAHLPVASNQNRLVLIDSLERAPELVDSSGFAGLEAPIQGVTVVIATRPGDHLDSLAASGAEIIWLEPQQPEHLAELREWIGTSLSTDDEEAVAQITATSGGNLLIASHLIQALKNGSAQILELSVTPPSLQSALAAMWNEVFDFAPTEMCADLVSVACMLSESGEPLPASSLGDFLRFSAAKVRKVLSFLQPLLISSGEGYRFFTPRLSQLIASRFRRDLVRVHEQVITFFREAYPSWEEMDDRYGWYYLGYHCDRLARTLRRQDFSTLHWLGEGPYIKAKLTHTHSLSAVLEDLRRCLSAALEERHLPRIVSYGLRIPRLRAEECANGIHDLADLGQFEQGLDRAKLFRGETARLKALLLLAWQAAEEGKNETALEIVRVAQEVVQPDIAEEDRLLYAYIFADLLQVMPPAEIRPLFFSCRNPLHSVNCALRLSMMQGLSKEMRVNVVNFAMGCAKNIEDDTERKKLLDKLTNELEAIRSQKHVDAIDSICALVAEVNDVDCTFGHNESMNQALSSLDTADDCIVEFRKALEVASNFRWEPRKVGALSALVKVLVARCDEDWVATAFEELIAVVVSLRLPEERQKAVIATARLITGHVREVGWSEVFVRLDAIVETIENPGLRVSARVWLALARYEARDYKGAQDTLNQSASLAFHVVDGDEQAKALSLLASCAASIGCTAKARDLAFHSLQIMEAAAPNRVDIETRAAMVVGVSANVSEERSLEYLDFSIKAAREIPDLRVRANLLAALAGGLAKLGETEWAGKVQEQALEIARNVDIGAAQAVTLTTLAVQESQWGNVSRSDQILQQAEQAANSETESNLRREALLSVAQARRLGGQEVKARKIIRGLLAELDKLSVEALAQASDLGKLAKLVTERKSVDSLTSLLKKARRGLKKMSVRTRDEGLLSLSHAWLALGNEPQARQDLSQIAGIDARIRGRVLLAKNLILSNPQESLDLLYKVQVFSERMRGIRECTVELMRDTKVSRRKSVLDTLAELTLMAVDDESTADMLVSRWVNIVSDRKAILDALSKLGYPLEEVVGGRATERPE